jgi:DNA-binding CsgD family transcriptional regulator
MKAMAGVVRKYVFAAKIAMVTAMAIILFECINLFVMYGYVRTDLYVSLAAVSFFAFGLFFNKSKHKGIGNATKQKEIAELLTARERQIINLIADGKTNKEIAAAFFIEISTVKTHLNNIYAKLSVKNRKEACAKYAQMAKS